jgi:hypothetical protein
MNQTSLLPCRRACLLLLLDHLLDNFSFFYEECTENPVCVVRERTNDSKNQPYLDLTHSPHLEPPYALRTVF